MAAVRSGSSAPGHKRITACKSTLPAWLTMISTTRCTHSCTPMPMHPHAENGKPLVSDGHRSSGAILVADQTSRVAERQLCSPIDGTHSLDEQKIGRARLSLGSVGTRPRTATTCRSIDYLG
jgi:hypothetical protein